MSTLHRPTHGNDRAGWWTRHSLIEALVRPGLVVVIDVLGGVLVDELAPGALAAARRREHAVAAQHPLNSLVTAAVAELEQLALDATKAPTRVLSGEANDELVQLTPGSWPAATGSPPIHGPLFAGPAPDASGAAFPGWAAVIATMAWA